MWLIIVVLFLDTVNGKGYLVLRQFRRCFSLFVWACKFGCDIYALCLTGYINQIRQLPIVCSVFPLMFMNISVYISHKMGQVVIVLYITKMAKWRYRNNKFLI